MNQNERAWLAQMVSGNLVDKPARHGTPPLHTFTTFADLWLSLTTTMHQL